jgi:hypothetical protein
MDEGFKGWKVVGVLFVRPDPEIYFHSGWIGFPTWQSALHGIVNLMGFWIAGPFHDHEMGIIVLVQNLIVLPHRRRSPSGKVEPGFRIQRIAVSGVTMFIDPRRNASILERGLAGCAGSGKIQCSIRAKVICPRMRVSVAPVSLW